MASTLAARFGNAVWKSPVALMSPSASLMLDEPALRELKPARD
jgi:hypothetical protein